MTSRGRYADTSGFTLLEILLSTVLLGMVSLSIYGVFSQGLHVEQRLRQSMISSQELFLATQTMVQDLQRMVPYTAPGESRGYFSGEPQSIAFIIADGDGLKEVRYEAAEPEMDQIHRTDVHEGLKKNISDMTLSMTETAERVQALVRKARAFPYQADREEKAESKILSGNVTENGLKFFYFGLDEDGNGLWKEKWEGDQWPAIIRIDLTLADQEARKTQMVRDVFVPLGAAATGEGYADQ